MTFHPNTTQTPPAVKVRHIAILMPRLVMGGTERLSLSLAREWTRLGHTVEFGVLSSEGELACDFRSQFTVVDFRARRLRHALGSLIRYFRHSKAEIFLVQMWPLSVIAVVAWWLAGKPGTLHLADHTHLSSHRANETFLLKWSIRLTYPLATSIIAVSEGVRSDLQALSRLPASRIQVIYNAIPFELPPLLTKRKSLHDPARLLAIGRLIPAKAHHLLLEAIARVRVHWPVSLTILGDGPLHDSLLEAARKLGIDDCVSFSGFSPDPRPNLESADLLVLSSTHEGFGLVLAEAMAFGLPVVSTDCPGGAAEVLDHGRYGVLVPVNDPDALAEGILKGLAMKWDPKALQDRAKDFSLSTIAKHYLDHFERMASSGKA